MKGSIVQTKFIRTIGTCTITEKNLIEPYDPYTGSGKNPSYEASELFPPDDTAPTDDDGDGDTTGPDSK